jgi:rRNA-processing protein FCF1
MQKIILDTNFLLIPVQFKVDIFSEIQRICDFNYKIMVLDTSMKELENLLNEKGKTKNQVKLTLELIKHKKVEILATEGELFADDMLVELAKEGDTIVATQDRELIKRLRCVKSKVITLRQKKYLIFR